VAVVACLAAEADGGDKPFGFWAVSGESIALLWIDSRVPSRLAQPISKVRKHVDRSVTAAHDPHS